MEEIIQINSVEQFFHLFGYKTVGHPLIGITRLHGGVHYSIERPLQLNLYAITCKTGCSGNARYGWRNYDYSTGCMNFHAPKQIIGTTTEEVDTVGAEGWMILFHPDFIRRYPLGESIKKYAFFSYAVNEALHLSDKEKDDIEHIIERMAYECSQNMDDFTQGIVVSELEVLLNYSNRYYARQFCTRASVEQNRVEQIEEIIDRHLMNTTMKMVTPQIVADEMNMTTHYLSDLLRKSVGQNTQQLIHSILIEKAKKMLCSTELAVSEIAYRLGFDYPQYFNRWFKQKTGSTPMQFRKEI